MNCGAADGHDEHSIDPNTNRDKMHLQCIGSFHAYTQDRECHTIEIWSHFGAVHDRDSARVSPTQLVLTTTKGFAVERIAQGHYRLTDNPEISLSSNDAAAP